MIPIKGYATFHPLKHCIVGRAHTSQTIKKMLGDNAPLEQVCEVMERTEEDIQKLIKLLQAMDVTCYRPTAQEDKKIKPPISPRDYFVVLGENLFVGKLVAGYKDIMKQIDRKCINWYLEADISSANMIRCGNHIHWDINPTVRNKDEKAILNWLHERNYRVSITRHGWHMDGVYSILKPGAIVASYDLPELRTIYPGWDICYLDTRDTIPNNQIVQDYMEKMHSNWIGNYRESNYDVNILSIDKENCITSKANLTLFKFLEKHKINPIVCDFRDRQFWDNGVHCITQDLYREGTLEDYFN
jgi:N-dimethylarginine dimethylaminohydrolase